MTQIIRIIKNNGFDMEHLGDNILLKKVNDNEYFIGYDPYNMNNHVTIGTVIIENNQIQFHTSVDPEMLKLWETNGALRYAVKNFIQTCNPTLSNDLLTVDMFESYKQQETFDALFDFIKEYYPNQLDPILEYWVADQGLIKQQTELDIFVSNDSLHYFQNGGNFVHILVANEADQRCGVTFFTNGNIEFNYNDACLYKTYSINACFEGIVPENLDTLIKYATEYATRLFDTIEHETKNVMHNESNRVFKQVFTETNVPEIIEPDVGEER